MHYQLATRLTAALSSCLVVTLIATSMAIAAAHVGAHGHMAVCAAKGCSPALKTIAIVRAVEPA